MLFTAIFVVVIAYALYVSIVIVPEGHVAIVQRFGKFDKTINPGINLVYPVIDKLVYTNWNRLVVKPGGLEKVFEKVVMCYIPVGREMGFDPPPVKVYTSDRIAILIDVLLTFRIVDPSATIYKIDDLYNRLQGILETTLASACSDKTTETIAKMEPFGDSIVAKIKTQSSEWGIEVLKIKVQGINFPVEVELANTKAMVAKKDADTTIQNESTLLKASLLRVERESKVKKEESDRTIELQLAQARAEAERSKLEADSRFYRKKMEAEAEYIPLLEKKRQLDQLELEFIRNVQSDKNGHKYLTSKMMASAFSELAKSNNKVIIIPSDAVKYMGNVGTVIALQDQASVSDNRIA
jgi:regulator of protease activity HflC (stomatin/prohibitin superfamily)